jgi:transcription elongation factor GreA
MGETPNLGEAASQYLAGLPAEDREASQHEIYKFIRWFGRERTFDGMNPPEIDDYSENAARSDPGHVERLSLVRAFLSYAKKKGWSQDNLSTHLKAKKIKARSVTPSRYESHEKTSMTKEGYTKMSDELASLKEERYVVIEEMTRAAADKDFRENAPLHAAREKRGMIEGRIIEIEATLKASVVIDENNKSSQGVYIGRKFILCDPQKGTEVCYTLVGPREADPSKGRISSVSPIGKAVMGKKQGEAIEINAPSGKICFQLKQIVD